MNTRIDSNAPSPQSSDLDVLITRLIDGEASQADRNRFESLANVDASLWRRLALRQQEMATLVHGFDAETRGVDQIELPDRVSLMHRARSSWLMAVSGWAAMIALATVWIGTSSHTGQMMPSSSHIVPAGNGPGKLSPDEHLNAYLQAPYVLGEMEPTLLEVTPMSDGRYGLRILRRIEEIAIVNSPEDVPVDEHGNLTSPPAELRQSEG